MAISKPNPSSVDHCHGLHSCERTQRKDLISITCILDEVFPKLRLLSCTTENALEMCMASFTRARAPCWSEPAATLTPVWLSSIRSRADRHLQIDCHVGICSVMAKGLQGQMNIELHRAVKQIMFTSEKKTCSLQKNTFTPSTNMFTT